MGGNGFLTVVMELVDDERRDGGRRPVDDDRAGRPRVTDFGMIVAGAELPATPLAW